MPTSRSYQEYLIQSLKDPVEAAAYIEAILEEKDPEPELLQLALGNVAEALGELNLSSEQAKIHKEKLNDLLSKHGSDAIYSLRDWLNTLGLKLSVVISEEVKDNNTNSASNSELTV
ncbi:MAG: transcriptional regulator [Potamolinea sp.]